MIKDDLDPQITARMHKKIFADILEGKSLQNMDNKVYLVVGGQTGAGKSSVIENYNGNYQDNIVILDIDSMKDAHPHYKGLLRSDSPSAHKLVKPYCDSVVKLLEDSLIEHGYNVMIERTLKDSNKTLESLEKFKNNGYYTEVVVVCANELTSKIGCILRYESDLASGGFGRNIAQSSHDEIYNKIPDTLNDLLASGCVDNVKICNRAGEVLAESINGDKVIEAYIAGRNEVDHEFLAGQIHLIEYMMRQRDAPECDLNEMQGIYDKLQAHKLEYSRDNERT